ncbi:MAG: ArsR/SmtB family transcription factor [Thermoleophilaceae bacterium]
MTLSRYAFGASTATSHRAHRSHASCTKSCASAHVAEPTRRRVLDLLREQELTVGELVDALDMSQPAVSKHLRVLRDAGLVEARVDARRRIYSLRPEPLADLDAWLAPYRKFWRGKLAALQRHLTSDD